MEKNKLSEYNHFIINGEEIECEDTFEVKNPATGEVIGIVPKASKEQTKLAIDSAEKALDLWNNIPADQRSLFLSDWANRIMAHQKEIAVIITEEQGKPINEAMSEVAGASQIINWYAEEGKRAYGEILPASNTNQRLFVFNYPIGVVGLITPTNMPVGTVVRKAAAALAAGCTFVLKPAPETPRSSIALIKHLIDTNVPNGIANVITGDAEIIGDTLFKDTRVRKVSFTGSTKVGKKIMSKVSDSLKRLSLELGGNCPAIVFQDADLDSTVEAIISNKFENSGQVCNGINRIYVHENLKEEFSKKLTDKVKQLVVDHGECLQAQIGPLVAESYLDKVIRLVDDAKAKGAKIITGGTRLMEGKFANGYFFQPTVLTDLKDDMAIVNEEVFGPVATILTFKSEKEIIEKCNATPLGLAAYFFTNDVSRIFKMINHLDVGGIGVNGTSLAYLQSPFGGIKQSGMGKEGGHDGLEEYLEKKYVALSY